MRRLAADADRGGGHDHWRPKSRPLKEWLADPRVSAPPRWVLPPLVQAGEVALLSAPPKTGKSQLVSQLAASLTIGSESIDGTPLPSTQVLWIALDEPMRRLIPRLAQLGADANRLHVFEREPGKVLSPEHLSTLIADTSPGLVVIDTTSQLALDAGIDSNDAASVGGFLRPLVDVVRGASTPANGCAGLFIHHAPHHAARAAGSLQWSAIVDADVVLRRPRRRVDENSSEPIHDEASADDGVRILQGTTRAGGPLRIPLRFSEGWYSLFDSPPLIDRARALLSTMETGPRLSSASAIRDRLRCSDSDLRSALAALEASGEVAVVGTGRSPNRHFVWIGRPPESAEGL